MLAKQSTLCRLGIKALSKSYGKVKLKLNWAKLYANSCRLKPQCCKICVKLKVVSFMHIKIKNVFLQ